jgi:hypothetical protein
MPDDRPFASPVFVDPTGRRRRTVRTTAVLGACSLFGAGALIVAALFGAPIGPTASLPQPAEPIPPAAADQSPGSETSSTGTTPRTRGVRQPGAAPVLTTTTTTPPGSPATTTTTTRGKLDHTPPGKPTDLPTPPGRTR